MSHLIIMKNFLLVSAHHRGPRSQCLRTRDLVRCTHLSQIYGIYQLLQSESSNLLCLHPIIQAVNQRVSWASVEQYCCIPNLVHCTVYTVWKYQCTVIFIQCKKLLFTYDCINCILKVLPDILIAKQLYNIIRSNLYHLPGYAMSEVQGHGNHHYYQIRCQDSCRMDLMQNVACWPLFHEPLLKLNFGWSTLLQIKSDTPWK